MSKTTVHVSNIHHSTTEKEVNDFFSFCGKILSIALTPVSASSDAHLSATINYERESAAKTALLLDGTKLGPNPVKVESVHSIDEIAAGHIAEGEDPVQDGAEVRQEDKPRTAILAEYLSHGYLVTNDALHKAIEVDKKHGITQRFTSILQTIDSKLHATDTAKTVDTQYHLKDKAITTKNVLSTYFEKALDTPTGRKIRSFYVASEKQVLDIHNEAKRLADIRQSERRKSQEMTDQNDGPIVGPEKTTCSCGGNDGACTCAPGKCACAGCGKKSSSSEDPAVKGATAGYQLQEATKDIKDAAADVVTGTQEKTQI